MYIIDDPGSVDHVSHAGISRLIAQRIMELKIQEHESLSDMGNFVVIEPGDKVNAIEKKMGCYLTTGYFGEEHYGDPDFITAFEWLEYHTEEDCFEIAFVMTDDFFTAVFVPDDPGIDPTLLAFCREYS